MILWWTLDHALTNHTRLKSSPLAHNINRGPQDRSTAAKLTADPVSCPRPHSGETKEDPCLSPKAWVQLLLSIWTISSWPLSPSVSTCIWLLTWTALHLGLVRFLIWSLKTVFRPLPQLSTMNRPRYLHHLLPMNHFWTPASALSLC